MGRRIIKQPNGKYAIFSNFVDDFIVMDISIEQYIEFRIQVEADRIKERILEIARQLEAGEKPYYQFTTTWEETIEDIKKLHGEETESLTWLRENGLIGE